MKFKIDDKVILLDIPRRFTPSRTNPVKNSKYECEGIVISIDSISNIVTVRWDNNYRNIYYEYALDYVYSNKLLLNSIW